MSEHTEEELSEMIEDAFVNIKEACKRLQERTGCTNNVVIDILNDVSKFYQLQESSNK